MSEPELPGESEPKKAEDSWLKFWEGEGGVFAIIGITFFLLSFTNPVFLPLGLVFMVISFAFSDEKSKAKMPPSEEEPRDSQ